MHFAMKGVTDARGLRDLRRMHAGVRRATLSVHSSAHLDLYMLHKEKERLDKEAALLDKRAEGIQKRLRDIRRQMQRLGQSTQAEGRDAQGEHEAARSPPAKRKQWKTFSANY